MAQKNERPTPQPLDAYQPPPPEAVTTASVISPSEWRAETPESTYIDYMSIGGFFGHNTPAEEWSIISSDDVDIRYELRDGEQYKGQWPDSGTTERCEMGMLDRIPIENNTIVVSYEWMVEDGPEISSSWLTCGQFHSGMSMSPACEVMFHGDDHMEVSCNSGSSSRPNWYTAYRDDQPIERGHWYQMHFNIALDSERGLLMLWRDGELIIEHDGPVGYSDQWQTYWKQGVYRNRPENGETVAMHFRNLKIVQGAELPSPPETGGGGGGGIPTPDDKVVTVTIDVPAGVIVDVVVNEN